MSTPHGELHVRVPQIPKQMTPPENIWIEYGEFSDEYGSWHIHKPDEQLRYGIEYVPAPVWHDAKEPPEKDGYCAVARHGEKEWNKWLFEDNKWWRYSISQAQWILAEKLPDLYYSLPQPPEEK
jgi:hypothetical protein